VEFSRAPAKSTVRRRQYERKKARDAAEEKAVRTEEGEGCCGGEGSTNVRRPVMLRRRRQYERKKARDAAKEKAVRTEEGP
jgi:hypothetical protein